MLVKVGVGFCWLFDVAIWLQFLEEIWSWLVYVEAELLQCKHFLRSPIRHSSKKHRCINRFRIKIDIDFINLLHKILLMQFTPSLLLLSAPFFSPKNECINILIANPAFLSWLSQQLPLSTTRPVSFMSQDSVYN